MMQTHMSDRVAKLKQMQNDVKPSLSAERAKLATEAIEAYAFEPPVLQKAYMLSHILRNMTVFIQDGELVVGNQADKPRSAPVFPEFTSEWIVDEIDDFATRKSDPLTLTAEDRATLLEVLPRWKGKSFDKIVERELPEDVKHAEESGVMTVGNRDCSTGHVLPDYFNLLPRGLNYYKAQCQKKIDETVIDSQEKQNQIDFWNAVIISIDAAGAFAKRYSDLALELSKTEKDEKRKAELLEIAEVCAHVPLEPARTFHEAIQFVWFMHVIMNIENNGHGESLHRFDQYMNPYYVADKAAGRITEDEAIELIQCFFIKMTDVMKLRDKFYSQSFAGYPLWQNIIIGGQKGVGDLTFCREGLAGTGRTEDQPVRVLQLLSVYHDQIVGESIQPVIQGFLAVLEQLLCGKGDEDRRGAGGQRPLDLDLVIRKREAAHQALLLLEVQPSQIAVVLLGDGAGLKYIVFKLLLRLAGVHDEKGNQEHALVLRLQLFQKSLRILAVGSQIRRDDVHVIPGTDGLLLLLDLAAVKLSDGVLDLLDGSGLVH